MLSFLELPDGTLIAECHGTPVPINVLQEIYSWKVNGLTMDDIVQRLRVRTVPNGQVLHSWRPGMFHAKQTKNYISI